MTIEALSSVILYVRDMGRSVSFYRDTLGVPFKFEENGYAEFATEGAKLGLFEISRLSSLIGPAGRGESADRGIPKSEALFIVGDVDSQALRLREAGVHLLSRPTDRPWGHRTMHLLDPDGNVIELAQEIPRTVPRRSAAKGTRRTIGEAQGVLLDMDGVLTMDFQALPGAIQAIASLRALGIPFLVMTNATSSTRRGLARRLQDAGFDIRPEEMITAVVATAAYLRGHHPGARCYLLGGADAVEDLDGVTLVDERPDVVVMAGPDQSFTWESMNLMLRMLLDGAALVGMHRNLYWMTHEGLKIDAGAYLSALERAAGVRAQVPGKPAAAYFEQARSQLGLPSDRVAMVGDDIDADVLAAQAVGLIGVLVRTGKFSAETLERSTAQPDVVLDSVADLPGAVRPGDRAG